MTTITAIDRSEALFDEGRILARLVDAVEAVGRRVDTEGRALARSRVRSSRPGGYVDSFEASTEPRAHSIEFVYRNGKPYAAYVSDGRPPGRPVARAYVDNPENRRLGRVGASYVHHYTGMPPASSGLEYGPRWVIARDGIPPKYVARDIRRLWPLDRFRREIAAEIGRGA